MVEAMECCGLGEISGISSRGPKEIVKSLSRDMFADGDFNGTYMIFSDTGRCKHGNNLRKYIKKHKLGQVYSPRKKRNPNSGSTLKAYFWTFNQKRLKQFAIENKFVRREWDDYYGEWSYTSN